VIPATVHVFCALVTLLCAALLLRHYGQSRSRLLLWTGLCFACLAVANILLFVDAALLPGRSLFEARLAITAIGMALLLYGLVWEGDAR
jgi:uncharacterized PurR-regulated membrane protein YhhQ (DUF165 family)